MIYSHCFPAWGPYGKKYMGISRIADNNIADGVRFDMTVAPTVFGGAIRVPNTTLPSGCHPWRCSPDYSFFTYRYDLEWKDKVYAEVSYVKLSDENILIRTEITNNTEFVQNCLINYFESIEYPEEKYCALSLPGKCEFKKALDYDTYDYADVRPWDKQNPDGMKKGEFADKHFTSGFGLGDRVGKWHMPHRYLPPFGCREGDKVTYTIDCKNNYDDAVLVIRYRTSDIKYEAGVMVGVNNVKGDKDAKFLLNNETTITLETTDELKTVQIELGKIEKGDIPIELKALGTGGAELDFLCICEKCDVDEIKTKMKKYDFVPEIETNKCSDVGYITKCKYKNTAGEYVLRTFNDNTHFRRIETGALEDCMTSRLSNSDISFDDVTESFTSAFSRKHSDDGYFHNTIVHTIFVNPETTHTEYAVLSKDVTTYLTPAEYEKIYEQRKEEAPLTEYNKVGKKYEQSCEILKSTVLINAVYPIYKHGEYIVHHTPGKRWDCLYTWDSGFIGLGMTDYSERFARYSLDTYLSDEDNPDYAFLHHGSPVPVQMYLFLEMVKRDNDKSDLLALYPKLKLYYDFLAGKTRGSTTAKLKSGLTTTYDYFYSTSGMDDYPAQVEMMNREIRDTTAPVISSAQLIRCAKILRMTAVKTGRIEDAKTYTEDINRITDALNKYSWDGNSGYYSYVLHDGDYNPTGKFTTESGENLNKGLDGIYPIIAGVCNTEQKNAILAHLKNEEEMLSPYGISAVDMTAGYFKVNGYWNGNVWFPHQWFIWKSMLDLGEGDFAYKIAELALNVWKREVDYSYYTFEMVNVKTGRGGWFHNFGGLSTPITMWANAYFKAGTFNTGFDTWVDRINFGKDNSNMTAEITHFSQSENFIVLAVMNDNTDKPYRAYLDGEQIPCNERFSGTVEVALNLNDENVHRIEICND